MSSCCSIFGLILLVMTNLACLISFATPYWVIFGSTQDKSQGLWAFCHQDSCNWVFENDYKANGLDHKSDWWLASVGLVSGGFAMALFALLFATVALCCDCRGCNASHTVGGLLLLSFFSLSVAAVVFGVCAQKYNHVKVGIFTEDEGSGRQVGWSYWLDIGAAGLALLTGLVYFMDGRNKLQ